MRAIFVSYRRDDAEGQAGRLFDALVEQFGRDKVFMDVAGIEPGVDFRQVIDKAVTSCGVLLALIGRSWLDAKDENGRRRLDDPKDFVRLETASALKRNIPVIPVLVHDAVMPKAEQLPNDLKDLAYRNGVVLSHARWDSDVELLVKALRPHVAEAQKEEAAGIVKADAAAPEAAPSEPAPKPSDAPEAKAPAPATSPQPAKKSRFATVAAAAVVLVIAAAALTMYAHRKDDHKNSPDPVPQACPDPQGRWMAEPEFSAYLRSQKPQIPVNVEGRVVGQKAEYRAAFTQRPTSATLYTYGGPKGEEQIKKDIEQKKKDGYSLKCRTQTKDTDMYTATFWKP